jgi:hypothetical protein
VHFFCPSCAGCELASGALIVEFGKFHPLARELFVLPDRMIAPQYCECMQGAKGRVQYIVVGFSREPTNFASNGSYGL